MPQLSPLLGDLERRIDDKLDEEALDEWELSARLEETLW